MPHTGDLPFSLGQLCLSIFESQPSFAMRECDLPGLVPEIDRELPRLMMWWEFEAASHFPMANSRSLQYARRVLHGAPDRLRDL
jgi:hypothetical protein